MNRTKFIINKCYHAYFLQLTRVTVAVMTTEHVFDASWRLSARTVAMTVCVAFFERQTLRYSINICLQNFDYKVDMIIQNRQKQLVFQLHVHVAYPRIGIYRKSKNSNSKDVGNSDNCNYFRLHSDLESRFEYVCTIGIFMPKK